MELWKEKEEEDRRIFPATKIDELRVELGRWIRNMNISVALAAYSDNLIYSPDPNDYRGELTKCRITIEAMGVGSQVEYPTEYAIRHAGPIAEQMLARWGREFARHQFLRKDVAPRVTGRQ